jgi:hypothetical protein
MQRFAKVLFAAAALGMGLAQAAYAAPPTVTTFSAEFPDTMTCPGITIHDSVTGRETDIKNTPDLFQAHIMQVVTLTANGKTLTDNEAFNVKFAAGVARITGANFNIQAPGVGRLLMDVGIIVFDLNGNVFFQGGPHPGFYREFQPLCDYLAGP